MSDVAHDQIKAFVRRIEALEDEIHALNGDKSEVYKEAKGNGFDTKVLRKVIAKRRLGEDDRNEQDALFDLYWNAVHGVVHAHVEIIEQFVADALGITEVMRHGINGVQPEPEAPRQEQTADSEGGEPPATLATNSGQPSPEGRDGGATSSLNSTPVPAANIVALRSHNPETHFLSEKGLVRLHGCMKPEICGSSQPRLKLCFDCSRLHDGPTAQIGGAA